MKTGQIALQLYTVREHTANDMLGTLRRLSAMGYTAVEFAGYGGVPIRDIRSALDDNGLRAIANHVQLKDLEERRAGAIEELAILGCSYAVVPSVPADRRQTTDQVRTFAEFLNRSGEQCRAAGLQFGYHNHAFEFAPLGDTTMFDILVAETDPALVGFELDVYWAEYAGVDALALIQRLTGRVPLLHVKDMSSNDSRVDVPLGDGILPWRAILAAGETAETQWFIVEQDHPTDSMQDVERSLKNLTQLASA
ncbi:MAG: sugar phosphate isomerase/epimerase [Herpetosiphon sp.]